MPGGRSSVADLPTGRSKRVPDWVKYAIWWQVYPLGFTSAEATGEPEDGAGDAHFDKGVLHLTIKKPAKAVKTTTPAR